MPFIAYKITHKDSGKAYIGITTQKRPQVRWQHHINVGRRGIGAAIKKYGASAFCFEVIACAFDAPSLLRLEADLIKQEGTIAPNGYNLNAGGNGTLEASVETRKLIGEANSRRIWSEESKAKVAASLTGRKMPESHRLKSAARMKLNNPSKSQDVRDKISAKAKVRCASPEWSAFVSANNAKRVYSEQTKAKIAASVAAYYANKIGQGTLPW